MEIKERILEYIKYKGITKNKFETTCGLPVRYVSNIGNSIQSDVIKKIILSYPDINLYWLLLGEGQMTRQISNDFNDSKKFRTILNNEDDMGILINILSRFLDNQKQYQAIMKDMMVIYERINNK